MGQVLGTIGNATNNTASYTIVDVPSPGVIGPCVVNNYTTLSIPAYFRAVNFKSANMASFPRSVRLDNTDVPHRLDSLLERKPNGYQSATMLYRTWFFHLAHYSNGYIEIERDALFNPKALHNRQPEIVAPFRYLEDDGSITGWYWVGGYKPHIVASNDMLHLCGLSHDGQAGLNPIWLHAETFERSRLMDRYITRFLVKGSVVRGSIELPAGLTEDQATAIVSDIRKFRGADAENDMLVLSGGSKLNNAGISNNESQLIQLHDASDIQIAQLTDVHPYFLYADKNGKYNNSPAQAGEDIVRYLFRLLIEQAEDELMKLLSDDEQAKGYKIHIDPTALTRGDGIQESAIATQLVNGGILSRNEGRELVGYAKSADPSADGLHALGSTAPKADTAAAPAGGGSASSGGSQDDSSEAGASTDTTTGGRQNNAAKLRLEAFNALITDASQRVGIKTDKATENASKKYAADHEGRSRWVEVFSREQAAYVASAVAPILSTIAAVTGTTPNASANEIGDMYALQLREAYNTNQALPDLSNIITTAIRIKDNG